ncbi:MAG: N-acetylglucosamine-6-phosphate deacetylase [Woeseiaceae bacterium]
MPEMLLSNCRLFDGRQLHDDLDVVIEAGRIREILARGAPRKSSGKVVDLGGELLAPGFIDLQVNGGGGALFNAAPTIETLRTITTAHRAFGTTACLPTLISDDPEVMRQAIDAVSTAMQDSMPGVLGIHLEGPHLNAEFRGVHDAAFMRPLDDDALQLLTSLAAGRTLLTIAPETVPAETIAALCAAGVTVFGGHSAATFAQARVALDAGMSGFTHLFNAMTPLKSREPGMVGAALDDAESYVGIIADGYHVHPATLRVAIRAKTRGKVCLVTDAMPVVGATATSFDLYGQTITATDGRCVTAAGVLAGSSIGMCDAVRNTVRFGGVELGEALRMASAYPATAIGVDDDMGFVGPGYRANLVTLDADLNVTRSWIDGDMQVHS